MKLGLRIKLILTIIILIGIGGLLVWAFLQGRKELTTEQEGERPIKVPSRITVQGGESVVTLDKTTQTRSGIVIAPLKSICYREELPAYGVILELQGLVDLRKNLIDLRKNLVDLRNSHAAAKAQVEKTQVSLDASRNQYERLKILYEDNRNVSGKALQAGEVAWRSDEANARAAKEALYAAKEAIRAAEEALQVLNQTARQQWGRVLTKWLFEASPAFERLIKQKDFLIQITLPSGVDISSPPETASIQAVSGRMITARFVSSSPRTDPRIQGLSFLYLVPAQAGILPGMSVRAYLPVGEKFQGIVVPTSAVVWWQGKAWVYMQKDSNQFARHEMSTGTPHERWMVYS